MSKTFFVSLASVISLWTWMPVLTPAAPQSNDGPIAIHPKHPQIAQKAAYASRAEWPRISSQVHWSPSENPIEHLLLHLRKISHAHMECNAPIYGMLAKAALTLNCQVQAFHLPGVVTVFSHGIYPVIEWDTTAPMIGDPNGVVVRQLQVTFSADMLPQSGIWRASMTARAQLDNGTHYDDTQEIPMCVNCTGNEDPMDFILTTHVSGFFNATVTPGARGGPTVDLFGLLPIIGVPLDRRYEIPMRAFAYQQPETFPGGGAFEQVHNPNIHFGDPGILWRRIAVPAPAVNGVVDYLILDPVVLGAGNHKVSAGWKDSTEAGNAFFPPAEEFMAFVVLPVTVGTGTTPPPPVDPVPCGGVWGWAFTDAGLVRTFTRVFTVSTGSLPNCIRPLVPSGG